MSGGVAGPVAGVRMTRDYVRSVGRLAYLWGWPLVNMHNRLSIMEKLPGPGLLGGVVPAASPGSAGMLHDYITPDEKLVACPNQDVVYGFGIIDATRGPSVVQVPDFGGRFWVYQAVDQRTDSFVRLGAMYQTRPGPYLLAPAAWDGPVPDGIAGVFRFDTRIAMCAPRVFMDATSEDRAAIQPVLNQVMVYPLSDYTGAMRTTDWTAAPEFPAGDATSGKQETQWVDPGQFFGQLPEVMAEVPARPGEEALYGWVDSLLKAAAADPQVAEQLTAAAVDANAGLVAELFQFRNIGLPLPGGWSTQRNGARFGTDYLSRTAMGKANIFVNTPEETHLLLPGPRRARRAPARVPLLLCDLSAQSPAAGPRLLVADAVQRAPLLPPQPAGPLLAGHQEQEPAPRRRRLADPDRFRHAARRRRTAEQLAARPRRTVLLVPARLLAPAANPRRHLGPAARHPVPPVIRWPRMLCYLGKRTSFDRKRYIHTLAPASTDP
jgi:hypothetical protein